MVISPSSPILSKLVFVFNETHYQAFFKACSDVGPLKSKPEGSVRGKPDQGVISLESVQYLVNKMPIRQSACCTKRRALPLCFYNHQHPAIKPMELYDKLRLCHTNRYNSRCWTLWYQKLQKGGRSSQSPAAHYKRHNDSIQGSKTRIQMVAATCKDSVESDWVAS